jgi:glycosyltransferase involved in cell wall biosynthesis
MPSDGLVSTIIPVHNRPLLLREAVESVLAQTYRLIEVVIVDDGSTDETAAVAAGFERARPDIVRVARIANSGPGAAREAGRQLARGEFLQYLDSDDLLAPTKFEIQVAALRASPECGAAYGHTRAYTMGRPPRQAAWKRTGERIEMMFPSFLASRWWETSTPLYRRAVCDRAGAWTSLRSEEDWEYDCRIASLGVRLAFCDAHVSDYRSHDGAMLSRPADRRAALRDRAASHAAIFAHARFYRIDAATPEMRVFARSLFLLARRCGAAGLASESRALFDLSRDASGDRAGGWDFLAYRTLAGGVGWRMAGALACRLDGLRA